jgi:hypothetical protein
VRVRWFSQPLAHTNNTSAINKFHVHTLIHNFQGQHLLIIGKPIAGNMKKKITQRQAIFYQLYKNRLKNPDEFIPIWQLIGEVYAEEINLWGFVSYEVSARMSELWSDNLLLFERKQVVGRTGAKYYAYRIRHGASSSDINDKEILEFYQKIKRVIDHKKITNA